MSKSTTSTRSNSVETPGTPPDQNQDDGGKNDNNRCSVDNELNYNLQQDCCNNTMETAKNDIIPTSPPPSYEHVLEETRMAAEQSENLSNENVEETSTTTSDYDQQQNPDSGRRSGECSGEGSSGDDDAYHHHHHHHDHHHNCIMNEYDPSQLIDVSSYDQSKGPKILHKSSKELYKAVAKQFGITCKMSDQCRCFDCQSHYFECEYEENEQEKTDGGLGAGTPMFISEVMHGSACSIL